MTDLLWLLALLALAAIVVADLFQYPKADRKVQGQASRQAGEAANYSRATGSTQ